MKLIHPRTFQSGLLLLVIMILGSLPLLRADSTISSPPSNSWDFLNQEHLAGNFYGYRSIAETNGVVLSGGSINDLFGNTTGGAATGNTCSGVLSLSLAADLQKTIGWEGGSFKTTWVGLYGSDISANVIKNGLTVSSIAADPAFKCSELWLQQNLFHDALSLRAGLLGIATEFMISDTASIFVNSTFSTPALFSLNVANGASAYSLPTPSVRLALQPTSWLILHSAIAQVNPLTQQEISRSFNLNFGASGGILALTEIAATWNKDPKSQGLLGTLKTGFWIENGQHEGSSASEYNNTAFSYTSSGGYDNSGFYSIIDQQLYAIFDPDTSTDSASNDKNSAQGDKNPQTPDASHTTRSSKGLSSFAQIGWSPQPSSPVGFYTGTGLVYTGLIPTRDDDKLGIAFAYAQVGSRHLSPESTTTLPGLGYEAIAELTYSIALAPSISIQPDLQYILHPGGTQRYGNALALGVRAVIDF